VAWLQVVLIAIFNRVSSGIDVKLFKTPLGDDVADTIFVVLCTIWVGIMFDVSQMFLSLPHPFSNIP